MSMFNMLEYDEKEYQFVKHLEQFINGNGRDVVKKELVMCLGPMFSGKTTLLYKANQYIQNYNNETPNNNNKVDVFVLNSAIDTREKEPVISSHNKLINGQLQCIKTNTIHKDFIIHYLSTYETADVSAKRESIVLLIDECQFYYDLLFSIHYLFERQHNVNIFIGCFGLNGDFNANLIGETHKLIPFSKDIVIMKSTCVKCKKDALFSHNKLADKRKKNSIINVGGDDKYVPLCEECFFAK